MGPNNLLHIFNICKYPTMLELKDDTKLKEFLNNWNSIVPRRMIHTIGIFKSIRVKYTQRLNRVGREKSNQDRMKY